MPARCCSVSDGFGGQRRQVELQVLGIVGQASFRASIDMVVSVRRPSSVYGMTGLVLFAAVGGKRDADTFKRLRQRP